ncbi:MAG: GatB/YqeY domain-containing protein [Desulfofustis sp.]|nr:GatB/YqeY domain-containing protein [Desulfofustis sp.]
MSLQTRITADLKTAMKNRDRARTDAVRVLIGEFQRQPDKELSDQQVAGIIKKLIKSEKELLAVSGQEDSGFIAVLEGYLPQQASEEEIREWISAHINFSEFNNKMQAMKPIMAHFGGNADGSAVKKILQSFDD